MQLTITINYLDRWRWDLLCWLALQDGREEAARGGRGRRAQCGARCDDLRGGGGYLYSWLAQSCSPPGLLITAHCSSTAPSPPPAAAAAAAAAVVHEKSLAWRMALQPTGVAGERERPPRPQSPHRATATTSNPTIVGHREEAVGRNGRISHRKPFCVLSFVRGLLLRIVVWSLGGRGAV